MGGLRGIWDLRRNAFEVVAGATHERVSEAAEIGAVAQMLYLPLMCETEIVPSTTHSRVEFSLFSMWRLPLVVMLWYHLTQASLWL